MSRTASATRSPTTGSASPATRGRSPTPTSSARSRRRPTRCSSSASTTGDRVAIYMPMIPELPIAMLACARIGAPHTVVFGGFSAEALAGRINDAEAKLVITADGGWRRGKAMPLKAGGRRGRRGDARPSSTSSSSAASATPRRSTTDGRGPRRLVARHRRAPGRRLPAGPARQRAHALPALHVGHDRQAEGHHPHDRRLPPRHVATPTR